MADQLVVISENGEQIQLTPPTVNLKVGDSITWQSELLETCQIGNFFSGHCLVPAALTLEPNGFARAFVIATPPSRQSITYWCTPTAEQDLRATDSYDPAQGIIIVDPPLPGDDDDARPEKKKHEALVG